MKKLLFKILFIFLGFGIYPSGSSLAQEKAFVVSNSPIQDVVIPNYHYDFVPDFTYEMVEERIKKMETEMPFELNDKIFSFIHYFTVRNREYMKMILSRKEHFFPLYVRTLKAHQMPQEIQYLSIIESGLDPRIKSHAGAMGLWQFMPATGRMYGMYVNQDIDDRMDPEKSTDAAAKYLKSLYGMFGDWEVALAAYNCGPGNVQKAKRRSGGKSTFWEIYEYLPKETRSYVPQFQAMIYILNHLEEHNLHMEEPTYPIAYEEVKFEKAFQLEKLAEYSNVCLEDLVDLNPSIKNGKVPESNISLSIKIPKSKILFVKENLAWIGDSLSKNYRPLLSTSDNSSSTNQNSSNQITYKVKSGDMLGKIAGNYGVSVANLMQWNNLGSSMIHVGQLLYIYSGSPSESTKTNSSQNLADTSSRSSSSKTYTVKPGDSLWNISQKHSLSIEQIKRLNNLNSTTIKPGQRLIIG